MPDATDLDIVPMRSRGDLIMNDIYGGGPSSAESEAAAIRRRASEWNSSIRPMNVFEVWMTEQMAADAIRVERCEDQEAEVRSLTRLRAKYYWDQDRRLDIEKVALGLAKRPSLVMTELKGTRYGCEWLATRWRGLAAVLQGGSDWTVEQRSLALDLLGVAPELRDGPTAVDVPGDPDAQVAARRTLAESWLHDLGIATKAGGSLERIDHEEYRLVAKGVMVRTNPVLAAIKKEAEAARKRIERAWTRIKGKRLDLRQAPAPAVASRSTAAVVDDEADDEIDDDDRREEDGPGDDAEPAASGRLRSYTPEEHERMRRSIDRMLASKFPGRPGATSAPASPAVVAATVSVGPARAESRRARRRKGRGR